MFRETCNEIQKSICNLWQIYPRSKLTFDHFHVEIASSSLSFILDSIRSTLDTREIDLVNPHISDFSCE